MPRITVITPVLNGARYIERTICSVLDQGYEDLEYFVIDGGSHDGTVDLIRLYEDDLAGWVSEPDAGPADAINRALRWANGDLVAVVPCGDLLMPGALNEVAEAASRSVLPSWFVGRCGRLDEWDDELGLSVPDEDHSLARQLLHQSGEFALSAMFIDRRVIDSCGRFDVRMRHAFGYEYACRLLSQMYTPTVLRTTLGARREESTGLSAERTLVEGIEHIQTAERYSHYLTFQEQMALWASCDQRKRIYALAAAETRGESARWYLAQQLLRHPWWITSEPVRQALLHGTSPTRGAIAVRRAA